MKKAIFILLGVVAAMTVTCGAVTPGQVRFHNEEADTAKLTRLLIEVDEMNLPNEQAMVAEFGRRLLGTPYVAGTLEGSPEMLTINTEQMDCTTFVETVLALAMTTGSHRSSWHDFVYNLEKLRYRSGELNGYPSRLHYISDWIVDNSHRGLLREVTDRVGRASYEVKTLDFMSSHRGAYPALSDSANFTGIKNVEVGYRSHRFPIIKPIDLKRAQLKEGDVVAITTGVKGLDVSHMAIVVMVDGKPHLMHASSKAGKVIVDPLSIEEYLRRNKTATGIRVIRLAQ